MTAGEAARDWPDSFTSEFWSLDAGFSFGLRLLPCMFILNLPKGIFQFLGHSFIWNFVRYTLDRKIFIDAVFCLLRLTNTTDFYWNKSR